MLPYLKNANAVHVNLHIIGRLRLHGDDARPVDLLEEAGGRVLPRNFRRLVEEVRRANLLVMADEALNLHWLARVAAQLHHRVAVAGLVLDGATTALRQVAGTELNGK